MLSIQTVCKVAAAGGMLAMMAGCGPSRAERAMAEKDEYIQRQKREIALHEQREQQYQAQLAEAQQTNQKVADQNNELAKRIAVQGSQTSAKIDSMAQQIADLEKKLGSGGASGVSVGAYSREPGAIVITVAGTTLFDSGSATLKSSSHGTLQNVAKTIKEKYPQNFVRVEGHTDSTPVVRNKEKFADNMVLSQARSKAVFDFLIAECGMPAARMYTAGYAYSQPVVWPEKTTADRAKNRRVDIVILPMVKVEKESLAKK